jgi:hypothetical protein
MHVLEGPGPGTIIGIPYLAVSGMGLRRVSERSDRMHLRLIEYRAVVRRGQVGIVVFITLQSRWGEEWFVVVVVRSVCGSPVPMIVRSSKGQYGDLAKAMSGFVMVSGGESIVCSCKGQYRDLHSSPRSGLWACGRRVGEGTVRSIKGQYGDLYSSLCRWS